MTQQSDRRGFASMDPERQRELASRGGKSVNAEDRAFSRNPELARIAGSKGGKAARLKNRLFSHQSEATRIARTQGRLCEARHAWKVGGAAMTARVQITLAVLMLAAYVADSLWIKPHRRHSDFISSRDCAFLERCWIK